MSRTVHIARGSSAGGCMKLALHPDPGTLLVSHDSLSCGPLRALESLDVWQQMRTEYWRNLDPEWRGPESDPRSDVLSNADTLRSAERIFLWIGIGIDEQLLLVWMIQSLRALDVPLSRLRVIQFGREPTRGFQILGVGRLNPDQIRAHPPEAELTPEIIAEIDQAWSAVTASDPAKLHAFVSNTRGAGSSSFLRESLRTFLFRYPDLKMGLNGWERNLLRYSLDKGPVAARVIGYTMTHDMESPDCVGDVWLFARMRHLADPELPSPFLSLSGSRTTMRGCEVTLTETGAKALEGEANFVELNGIDDWIGGVHLDSSKGNVWFCKDDNLVQS